MSLLFLARLLPTPRLRIRQGGGAQATAGAVPQFFEDATSDATDSLSLKVQSVHDSGGPAMRPLLKYSRLALFAAATALILVTDAGATQGDCGQPVTTGAKPTATDCLHVLKASVRLLTCAPECVCDTNGSGGVSSVDALMCLTTTVGDRPLEDCPCVEWPGGGTINESCTVCHGEGRSFDVASLYPGLFELPLANQPPCRSAVWQAS